MNDRQRLLRAAAIREQPLLWFFVLYTATFFGCAVGRDLLVASSSPWGRYVFPLALTLVPWLGLRGWARRVTAGAQHSLNPRPDLEGGDAGGRETMPEGHDHAFAKEDWPFADPVHVMALTTTGVLHEELPILLVTHDADDGMWQVLCGTTNDPAKGRVVCLGCLFEKDPTIGALADLPAGWRAWRDGPDAAWHRSPSAES